MSTVQKSDERIKYLSAMIKMRIKYTYIVVCEIILLEPISGQQTISENFSIFFCSTLPPPPIDVFYRRSLRVDWDVNELPPVREISCRNERVEQREAAEWSGEVDSACIVCRNYWKMHYWKQAAKTNAVDGWRLDWEWILWSCWLASYGNERHRCNFCCEKVLTAGIKASETSSVARIHCSNKEMIDFF